MGDIRYVDGTELRARCRDLVVKFVTGSNQGSQHLCIFDIGATDFLEVWRNADELKVAYVRLAPERKTSATVPIVYQKIVTWPIHSVFEYMCENIIVP